ncbi:MAG TPA: hypothetical protein VI322_04175 [Candidatus Saccharimonadia bacterium]
MSWLLHVFHLAVGSCPNQGAFPSLWDNMCGADGQVQISSVQDLIQVIANGVRVAMAVAGSLAVIAIILAAIYYILSVGDPARVKQAKTILTNAVVGLVIIMSAYAIVTFIAGGF